MIDMIEVRERANQLYLKVYEKLKNRGRSDEWIESNKERWMQEYIEGYIEGYTGVKKEIARKCKECGLSNEDIVQATGLALEDVIAL